MKTLLLLLAMILAAPAHAAGPAVGAFDDARIVRADDPAWFKTSFLDLRQDIVDARAAGKQGLMLLFSLDGCAYCKAFIERSLGDPGIAARVRRYFDVLHLEIFDDSEIRDLAGQALSVKAFAKREGAVFSPTVAFYGVDGRLLYRMVGYQPPERFREVLDYVIGGHYRGGSLRDYLARRGLPAPAATGGSATTPVNLDRREPAGRPLLTLFEQADCPDCAALHARELADPEVRALLARFQVTQLDGRDTMTPLILPDGQRRTPAAWANALGLNHAPALVFFDERGTEVLRIDAVVYRQRLLNALRYVLDKAYARDITYQRYAREKSLQRLNADKTAP